MATKTKKQSGKARSKVGNLAGAKKLTNKEAKKVKGGIIAVLIGRSAKKKSDAP